MTKKLKIVMAQLNFLVGDIQENAKKIILNALKARDLYQADLVIFPELALTGYPPEDLLLRQDFHIQVNQALALIKQSVKGIDILFGYPERTVDGIYNSAILISDGQILANYHKQCLPNYGVFDEKRYFKPGEKSCVIEYKGIPLGIVICEDVWFPEPTAHAARSGAELILCINASPFDIFKLQEREKTLRQRIQENHLPTIYVHCVGGQDELLFDGRSMVLDHEGNMVHLAPVFEEMLMPIAIEYDGKVKITSTEIVERLSYEARTYKALVTALHDYVEKNNFPGVLLGLSGGIDSALVLTLAVDALGKDRVHAVMMPSRYTAQMSIDDATELAKNLGVKYSTISIEPAFNSFLTMLENEFKDTAVDTTEENMQARIRGIILMALSNKFGKLVLTTGNKSEMAVGYATLYGDMAGGFAILKDVYKTLVYKLANYRNSLSPVIPERIITRPPSAELAHGQTDQDTLPPYEELDQILNMYVEHDASVEEITRAGFDEGTVRKVVKLVERNEYKRRQAPPGPKITTRAFGRDRRYPITSGFKF